MKKSLIGSKFFRVCDHSRSRFVAICSIVACSLLFRVVGHATPITVLNHSFEVDDLADGINLNVVPPSWSVSGPGASYLDRNPDGGANAFNQQIDPTPDPMDAEQLAWSNGGDLFQVLGTGLAANTRYTLTVDVGDRTNLAAPVNAIRLGSGSAFGSDLLSATIISNAAPLNGADPNDGWEVWVSTFVTGSNPLGLGDPLRVELVSDGVQVLFDNVRLDATVIPEPGAVPLLVLGGVILTFIRGGRGADFPQ